MTETRRKTKIEFGMRENQIEREKGKTDRWIYTRPILSKKDN